MKILCATDLLPKSEPALERAGLLSEQLGADLMLLHVVVPHESEQVLEQQLQAALAQMESCLQQPLRQARPTPEVTVEPGNAAQLILQTLEESKARLMVLGPHRRRSFRDVLEGTIAEKALSARACPVLIVRNQPRATYRRVLLAVDFSAASVTALRAAQSLVLTSEVDAEIVHAHEPLGGISPTTITVEDEHEAAESAIRDLLTREHISFARWQIRIEQGDPGGFILRSIERYRPDLLIMGTRGHGRLRRTLLGSVANRVLNEVACDALIVPEGSRIASRRQARMGGHRSAAGTTTSEERNTSRITNAH